MYKKKADQKKENQLKRAQAIAKLPPITLKEKGKPLVGRPTGYTEALGKKVCDKVATTTDGLRRMCANNSDFPTSETILQWRYKYPEFAFCYAQAKLTQADLFAEQIIDICDEEQPTSEAIQHARLRVDTRKWVACKLIPRVYGDKVQTDTTLNIKHEDALEQLK